MEYVMSFKHLPDIFKQVALHKDRLIKQQQLQVIVKRTASGDVSSDSDASEWSSEEIGPISLKQYE